jgi:hypothetical protein
MTRRVLIGSTLALALVASLPGCKDNEESFYIEHMKILPDAPECKYSTGDQPETSISIDLAFSGGDDFYGGFQVTNALMAREDYDNLKAESNGIFIDGAEAAASVGGQAVGGSVYRGVDFFIDAETTSVVQGIFLAGEIKTALADALNCPSTEETGATLAADLADGDIDNPPQVTYYDAGTVSVRFIGHSQGGEEVETNLFTVAIQACCNCDISWSECSDPCFAFCTAPAEYSYCEGALGMNVGDNRPPCNYAMYSPYASWADETVDGGLADCDDCT